MKRTLTALLLLTVYCLSGQELRKPPAPGEKFVPEHEFRISAGAFPFFSNDMGDWDYRYDVRTGLDASKRYRGSTYTTGAVTASYCYRYLRWLDFGISLSYTNEYYWMYSNIDNAGIKRHMAHFISIIPTARFTWFRRRSVRMYSACGLGVTFLTGDIDKKYTSDSGVGLQLTYFGISAGKRVFGFAELGTGAHGTLIGGVGYRFNGKNAKR